MYLNALAELLYKIPVPSVLALHYLKGMRIVDINFLQILVKYNRGIPRQTFPISAMVKGIRDNRNSLSTFCKTSLKTFFCHVPLIVLNSLKIHSLEGVPSFQLCSILSERGWPGEVAPPVYGQLCLSGTICLVPCTPDYPANSFASGTVCSCAVLEAHVAAGTLSCSDLQSCGQGCSCRNGTSFPGRREVGEGLGPPSPAG